MRIPGENIRARADAVRRAAPTDVERSAQQDEAPLLAPGPPGPHSAARQVAHGEMNGVPAKRPRRQVHGRPGPAGGHAHRSIQRCLTRHRGAKSAPVNHESTKPLRRSRRRNLFVLFFVSFLVPSCFRGCICLSRASRTPQAGNEALRQPPKNACLKTQCQAIFRAPNRFAE